MISTVIFYPFCPIFCPALPEVVCGGDDVHVEVGDSVQRPVEPCHHLAGVPALLPQHPQPRLLHLLHHGDVVFAQTLDILDAGLITRDNIA